jgi:hypothetical protein
LNNTSVNDVAVDRVASSLHPDLSEKQRNTARKWRNQLQGQEGKIGLADFLHGIGVPEVTSPACACGYERERHSTPLSFVPPGYQKPAPYQRQVGL